MNKLAIIISVLSTVLFTTSIFAQKNQQKFEKIDISMYPKAKEGFKQVVIQLPISKNEGNLRTELLIGSEQMVDCNVHNMIGKVIEETVEGWGYTFFTVESAGESTSTMMACLDTKLTKQFVSMPATMTSYNSKMPIVMYVPKNLSVKYRIWRADLTYKNATSK